MVNIPEDIMFDILIRLPVKSIGRFRCVKKAWCSFLKDPKFVKMHLKHAVEMNKFHLMLRQDSYSMKTIGYNSCLSNDNGLVNVDYPLKYETGGVKCLGYCDGLVWFVYEVWLGESHVCIWNPATNEYRELPVTPTESLNGTRHFENAFCVRHFEYGFGYDYEIEDFKVVSLMSSFPFEGSWSEVQVYTLRSNSWRVIGKIPYDVYDPMPDMARVPVNGALHWIVERTTGALSVIVSFDLAQEIIKEIALPNLTDEMYGRSLCVLNGSLCVLGNDDEVWELWEFKNYETEDSWTKLFTIHPEQIFGFKAYLMPLHKLGNGNILLGLHTVTVGFHLIMYDPKQETFTIKFYEEVDCHHFYTSIYVESLVSLDSGAFISAETVNGSHEKREQWVQCKQIQDVNENDYFSGGDDADDASDSDVEE